MSLTSETTEQRTAATNLNHRNVNRERTSSWSLWTRQTLAILRIEIKKNFLSRRAFLLYLMAGLPLVLLSALALFPPPTDELGSFNEVSQGFAMIYGGLILRTLIFFGCAWIFTNLFRGEVIDRSLHYYFLAPVRREVLVVGKYLSGLIATIVLFSVTTVGSMFICYFWLFPSESAGFFFDGASAGQMLSYLAVTIFACLGYGAVFLLVGLFFRNPIIPGLIIYGWEWINFLLPPLLKKISVIHYLTSLVPVPMSEGPFAVLVEPTPAWISVPSLFLFMSVMLYLASRHIRRMEISYVGI